ncbi:Ecdysteroid UDP-glucosyltransferase [Harpegnathos saltator]|uniref:Ecdysteroid UDP-glucosyltransferase n=1 Tax=Harpegnathos saltator TaxID=610380 RepID=E2BS75_HARSA|nr:Ecdysteroid UDP-glucosyltransferase [Harpegnathos saltator]
MFLAGGDAADSFIYVSLGTNIDTTDLSGEIIRNLTEVFSALSCKALWKTKGQHARSNLASNIFTAKWPPLTHPNIQAFVYHGGLRSAEKAVHYAAPLTGIPFLYNQDYRIYYLTSLGAARHLDISACSKEDINNAIRDLLSDTR